MAFEAPPLHKPREKRNSESLKEIGVHVLDKRSHGPSCGGRQADKVANRYAYVNRAYCESVSNLSVSVSTPTPAPPTGYGQFP